VAHIPLLVADRQHRLIEVPDFAACGMAGSRKFVLRDIDLIRLPKQNTIFYLPQRSPLGYSLVRHAYEKLTDAVPVAALLPPGYTQLYTTGYEEEDNAPLLPLYTYAPVVRFKGCLCAAALRVDRRRVHDITAVSRARLTRSVQRFRRTKNRLIRHLAHCSLNSHCPNAINFFLGRYECPLPVSPTCNARCLGCISSQPIGGPPASQQRLSFVPTPEEIAEVALSHIARVPRAIVSFGQGCEGEPLLQARCIQQAITLIRQHTRSATIHMNTNAGKPQAIEMLCGAGLNSIRVSLNSAQPKYYRRYFRPQGYDWEDVMASLRLAKQRGAFVSLNYLVMPGFTDDEKECRMLLDLIRRTRIDMIQWRNLNCDPQWFFRTMRIPPSRQLLGMRTVMERVRRKFPRVRQGYFNIPVASSVRS